VSIEDIHPMNVAELGIYECQTPSHPGSYNMAQSLEFKSFSQKQIQ